MIVQQTDVGESGLSEVFGQLAWQNVLVTPQHLALPIMEMTKVTSEKKNQSKQGKKEMNPPANQKSFTPSIAYSVNFLKQFRPVTGLDKALHPMLLMWHSNFFVPFGLPKFLNSACSSFHGRNRGKKKTKTSLVLRWNNTNKKRPSAAWNGYECPLLKRHFLYLSLDFTYISDIH